MTGREYIGPFEQLLLAAVKLFDGEDAYGPKIHQRMEEIASGLRVISWGAVYTTIGRLEKKGLVTTWMGGATNTRGGRSKRYAKLTKAGEEALKDSLALSACVIDAVWGNGKGR